MIRRTLSTCSFVLAGVSLGHALAGCAGVTPQQITKTALDVAQYACVIANEDLPIPAGSTLGKVVAEACGLDNTFAPVIEQVIGVDKASKARKMAAAHCAQ